MQEKEMQGVRKRKQTYLYLHMPWSYKQKIGIKYMKFWKLINGFTNVARSNFDAKIQLYFYSIAISNLKTKEIPFTIESK